MMASSSEAVHELIERIGQSRSNLRSEMGVDLRAACTAVSQILLNETQIDAGFKQVGSVRMPQGVDVSRFANPGGFARPVKGLSQSRLIEHAIGAAGCG